MSSRGLAAGRVGRAVLALHRRLLPNRPEIGWTPYIWLCYLSFFFLRWWQAPPSPTTAAWIALTVVVFLWIYFDGYWHQGRTLYWHMAGLSLLAIVWTPANPSSLVFFIYAAGFVGAVGPPRVGVRALLALSLVIGLDAWAFDLPWIWTLVALGVSWIVGSTNIYFGELSRKGADLRRSREEVRRLATVAERERIARDLHDLLGHTLSVITVKAELARKLSERGDDRARVEIADVERISRDALRQVREAVEGYREAGLAGEVARARIACEARQIELEARLERVALDAEAEAALGMVLREAVTNVVRHAAASRCWISLRRDGRTVVLTVSDDGPGVAESARPPSGSGLQGMRERLWQLGGTLEIEHRKKESPAAQSVTEPPSFVPGPRTDDWGWRIEARVPLADSEPAEDLEPAAADDGTLQPMATSRLAPKESNP